MVIGVCGYGATGSGAVIDLLREYPDIQLLHDMEFKIAYRVDGLQDLEYHLVKQWSRASSGDAAIKRFIDATNFCRVPWVKHELPKKVYLPIRDRYVDSLIQASWWGMESFDYESGGRLLHSMYILGMKKIILPRLYENFTKKNWKHKPCRLLYTSVSPTNFYEASIRFIKEILQAKGFDTDKDIFINQAFEGNDPTNSFPFFENPRAIIVDRDPRDVYLLTKKYGSMGESRWCPRDDVRDFIVYWKNVHKKKHEDNEDILRICFEDLIYDYDHTVARIEAFSSLSSTAHTLPGSYFKPDVSINNTQLFLRETKFADDVALIERELPEYLYDFSRFDLKPDIKGKTF